MKIFYRILVIFNCLLALIIAYLSSIEFDHMPIGEDLRPIPSYAINDAPFFIQKTLIYVGCSLIISFCIILVTKGLIYLIRNIKYKK